MTATLSSASVPITSESIRQTSGKYLHQIISTKKEKKGECESSTLQKPKYDIADVFAFAFASLPFAVACSHLSFLQFSISFSQLCTLANSHWRRKLEGRSGPKETPFLNLAWRNWWDDLLSSRWYIQLLQIFIISAKTQIVF